MRRLHPAMLVLILLGSAAGAGALSSGFPPFSDAAESHDPIRIDGDKDLLLPDPLANNGVRGGTGTEEDPWIISDWRIDARGNSYGIRITDVQGHLLLRNISVVLDHHSAYGFVIVSSPSVSLSSLHVSGSGRAMAILNAVVEVDGLAVESQGSGDCIKAEDSSLSISNSTLPLDCGFTGIMAERTNLDVDRVDIDTKKFGIWVHRPPVQASIRNVDIELVRIPLSPTLRHMSAVGLSITPGDGSEVTVTNGRFEWFDTCIAVQNAPQTSTVTLDDLDLEPCWDGISFRELAEGALVRNTSIKAEGTPLSAIASTVRLEDITLSGAHPPIRVVIDAPATGRYEQWPDSDRPCPVTGSNVTSLSEEGGVDWHWIDDRTGASGGSSDESICAISYGHSSLFEARSPFLLAIPMALMAAVFYRRWEAEE